MFWELVLNVATHVPTYPHTPPLPQVAADELSFNEMDEMLGLVQRVPLVTFDPALKHMLSRKQQWYKSIVG